MKTLQTLILYAVCFGLYLISSNLEAQIPIRTGDQCVMDSSVLLQYLDAKEDVEVKEKSFYSYNANRWLIEEEKIHWDPEILSNEEQRYRDYSYFEYDQYGNRTLSTYLEWNKDLVNPRTEYTRRIVNMYKRKLLTERLDQIWDKRLNEWISITKDLYAYDENGQVIEHVGQEYLDGTWQYTVQNQYSYDPLGYLVERINLEWDEQMGNWRNVFQELHSYNFDQNKTEKLKQVWSPLIGNWLDKERELFQYSRSGNMILQEFEIFNQGEWISQWRTQFEYNPDNNVTEEIYQEFFIGIWVNKLRSSFKYSPHQHLTEDLNEWWDNSTQAWIKDNIRLDFWSELLTSNSFLTESDLDCNLPNPYVPGQGIQCHTLENGELLIRLYDMNGRLMYQETPSGADVFNLPVELSAGLYYFIASERNREAYRRKLVIM